jgi:hypothetical protein
MPRIGSAGRVGGFQKRDPLPRFYATAAKPASGGISPAAFSSAIAAERKGFFELDFSCTPSAPGPEES